MHRASLGIRQGYPISPYLFLFVHSAIMDEVDKEVAEKVGHEPWVHNARTPLSHVPLYSVPPPRIAHLKVSRDTWCVLQKRAEGALTPSYTRIPDRATAAAGGRQGDDAIPITEHWRDENSFHFHYKHKREIHEEPRSQSTGLPILTPGGSFCRPNEKSLHNKNDGIGRPTD